jgi:two-component system sensor histidine kinase/response regulator
MTSDTKPVFRVLLAEDVKLNQILTQKLLARSGYQIDIAENGIQAVEALQKNDYDVILMDVQMPEMDGIEATRRIRELPGTKKFVTIIALTAQAEGNTEDELRAAGMDDYISKPINFDILFSKLSALEKKRET